MFIKPFIKIVLNLLGGKKDTFPKSKHSGKFLLRSNLKCADKFHLKNAPRATSETLRPHLAS